MYTYIYIIYKNNIFLIEHKLKKTFMNTLTYYYKNILIKTTLCQRKNTINILMKYTQNNQ